MTNVAPDDYILKKLDMFSRLYPKDFYAAVERTANKLVHLIKLDLIADYMFESRYIRSILLDEIRQIMCENAFNAVWEYDYAR